MRKSVLASAIVVAMFAAPAAAETLRILVESVEAGSDPATEQPVVTIMLKPESKAAVAEFSRLRVGEPATLRLGDRPLTQPIFREPITGGGLVISGNLTEEAARKLAEDIASGADNLFLDGTDK